MGFLRYLLSWFDLNGTASRKRGWFVFGVMVLALAAVQVPVARNMLPAWPAFAALAVVMPAWWAVLVQRLHDTGRSGWWVLLTFIPLLGLVAAVVILSLPPRGTKARAHPVARKIGHGAMVLFAALALSRAFLWQPYFIPSESNKPVLLPGDYVITSRLPIQVQRGDVVVFRHPVNGEDYIKRVIGLPGDKVQMQGGLVVIGDEVSAQTPLPDWHEVMGPQGPSGVTPRCGNAPVGLGGDCITARTQETLPGGRVHAVLNIQDGGPFDDTSIFTVPEAMYFVLGDNRDNSVDSRMSRESGGVGFVPADSIRGVAKVILFSSTGAITDVSAWRPGRYFQWVQ